MAKKDVVVCVQNQIEDFSHMHSIRLVFTEICFTWLDHFGNWARICHYHREAGGIKQLCIKHHRFLFMHAVYDPDLPTSRGQRCWQHFFQKKNCKKHGARTRMRMGCPNPSWTGQPNPSSVVRCWQHCLMVCPLRIVQLFRNYSS
jgi:hypothetical protein